MSEHCRRYEPSSSHRLKSQNRSRVGEFRVGAVVESVGSDNGVWVEIGIDRPIPLRTKKNYTVGQRLNVRIFSHRTARR